MSRKKIIIVGGGLAGLVTSIHLSHFGIPCLVIEKNEYPFHRVCGEYISNEVVPYLRSLNIFPESIGPSAITQFQLTSVNGRSTSMKLDLGGFGISRYQFDNFLYGKAREHGVEFMTNTSVEKIEFGNNNFSIITDKKETIESEFVIGCFGKRSRLDISLDRTFIKKRSPYLAVKYHINLPDFPKDLIALHNFKDGYCGISHVEDNRINLCYLSNRSNLKKFRSIIAMEEAVLYQNPFLKKIFTEATHLFDKPETINEISFQTKNPVENHILMVGDAAGMITPLCGNGMAIAIHSAKIVSELVYEFYQHKGHSREQLEHAYKRKWRSLFARRLQAGRIIQRLFGDVWSSNLAVNLGNATPAVAEYLMRKTHGKPF